MRVVLCALFSLSLRVIGTALALVEFCRSCCSHLIGMIFFFLLVFGVLLFGLALSGFSWMGLIRMDWGTGLCTVLIVGVMGHYNPSL